MIVLGRMRWGNLFSYGDNNEVTFSKDPLVQILGANGHGKSSIPLILEECLYNKNSKGIKKADILNRNINAKTYWIELDFVKDSVSYSIRIDRGSNQTVKLSMKGEDISAHTATATYKIIEDLIGYDHKTFAQIVYQSSSASLEFLTATDGNRKKFLIELLNLTRYVEAAELFKTASTDISKQVTTITANVASNEAWLKKYVGANLEIKKLLVIPENPRHLVEIVASTAEQIKNIDASNKRIIQNNKYKELLDDVVLDSTIKKPTSNLTALSNQKVELLQTAKNADTFIAKMRKLGSVCATCEQPINKEQVAKIIGEHTQIKLEASNSTTELNKLITYAQAEATAWNAQVSFKSQYEEYHSLYKPELDSNFLDKDALELTIKICNASIDKITKEIKDITLSNSVATAHNATAMVITSQLEEVQADLAINREQLSNLVSKLTTLQILVKTFSPTGLVAYKIECLIKDLEVETNKYLTEISSGRFQISFKIAGSDKLNVVITDNGRDIEILALSSGERARVNAAALLGIRKIMQSLSNNRINLLVLDETIENLDLEGKERLVEVLLSEDHLNTFVISHSFSHALIQKVYVEKMNGISKIMDL